MQRSVAQGLLPGYRRLNDSTVFSFFACSLSPSPHPLPPPAEGIINRSSKREISRRKRTRDPLFSRTHADSSSFNEPIDRLDRLEFSTVIRSLPFFSLSPSLPRKRDIRFPEGKKRWFEIDGNFLLYIQIERIFVPSVARKIIRRRIEENKVCLIHGYKSCPIEEKIRSIV